jgi:tRNA G10  N-methylase Trm11
MKYLFILGRNPELSLEEIKAYFTREENKILDYSIKDNALFIDLEKPIQNIIENFGGVISIGEVIASGQGDELIENIEKEEIYLGTENKFNYLLWDFSKEEREVESYLKKRFRKEKLKVTQKQIKSEMVLQSGEKVLVSSSGRNIDLEYFVFDEEDISYFGKITQKSDYDAIESRDMNKPVRRESLSISPRLSKIMINLSLVKPGEKMLDAFSGIGGILQEALIQGIKVIGVEKDKPAVDGAHQNLEFAGFSKTDYDLINFDSTRVKISKVQAMVSEPDLGETLKKMPTKANAKKTLREFEWLMIKVINNLKRDIEGRIVFTSPLIKHYKKRMHCNIERILEETGYSLVKGFPIAEFRQGQVVGREIYVLERNDL